MRSLEIICGSDESFCTVTSTIRNMLLGWGAKALLPRLVFTLLTVTCQRAIVRGWPMLPIASDWAACAWGSRMSDFAAIVGCFMRFALRMIPSSKPITIPSETRKSGFSAFELLRGDEGCCGGDGCASACDSSCTSGSSVLCSDGWTCDMFPPVVCCRDAFHI